MLARGGNRNGRRATTLLVAWTAILPVFVLANYRFDMIGKHLFFTMAPVAIASSLALYLVARRGRWGSTLAGLSLLLVAWQGISFWVERLVRASS
jgi:hypothetical protein